MFDYTQNVAVELTQRALDDLREIERYSVGEWGRKTTDKYLNDIAAVCHNLLEFSARVLAISPVRSLAKDHSGGRTDGCRAIYVTLAPFGTS